MLSQWHFTPYLLPLICSIILFLVNWDEKRVVRLSFVAIMTPFINTLLLIIAYFIDGRIPHSFDVALLNIFGHHFLINVYLDPLSLIVLFLTGYLSMLVGKFSHTYLHREVGFQRYFATILLLIFGMQIIAMAGTFDLFFAGWETVGISSFLLISFYRNRTRPAKNAFRIFTIYRLCDVGLLMGAILSHHILHEHATFEYISTHNVQAMLHDGPVWVNTISILILLAAMGKSAQFPFMNWPARAMEGPTPSSAIFYGALSIHCGVILLIRSFPFWNHSSIIHFLLAGVGALTFVFTTLIGRIQSNIKGQIAYAASAQIGIIFIELAFEQIELAMAHLFCHALYRCYQILISPSIVVDHIKKLELSQEQQPRQEASPLLRRIRSTFYSLALQDGLLELSERGGIFWMNVEFKLWARRVLGHVTFPYLLSFLSVTLAYAINHTSLLQLSAYACAGAALGLSLRSLISLARPKTIWREFGIGILLILLSPILFTPEDYLGACMYAATAIPFWFVGNAALKGTSLANLNQYNGLDRIGPKKTRWFLLALIAFSGLPFTTTFLGEDILLAELVDVGPQLLAIILTTFTVNGLVCARLLCKVFFGYPTIQRL